MHFIQMDMPFSKAEKDSGVVSSLIPASKVQFTIDRTAGLSYNRLDFYLANSIYNKIIDDKGQHDPNFEFVSFNMEPGQVINPRINIRHISISGRKNVNICLSLDKCEFLFKYKGHVINCLVTIDDTNVNVVTCESKTYTKLYISFENNSSAGSIFEELIKSSVDYSEKYMLDNGNETTKLNIYGNDDGFWEKVLTRKKRAMDTIYLPLKDKNTIIDDITKFLEPETKRRYESLGRTHKRVFLFEGIPGSGKTSFITALASLFDYDVALITFTDKVTDGVLMRLLKNMPEKTILVLEDIDVLFTDRKKNDDQKNLVTFSGILNTLDGITTRDGFICIMTTNYKNTLDPALLRPGRVDKQLEFKPAIKEQIQDIFIRFMGDAYSQDLFRQFYSAYLELNIEASMSLIQEYLFKYLDDTKLALSNIGEIKVLHDSYTKNTASIYT